MTAGLSGILFILFVSGGAVLMRMGRAKEKRRLYLICGSACFILAAAAAFYFVAALLLVGGID